MHVSVRFQAVQYYYYVTTPDRYAMPGLDDLDD